MVNQAIRFNQSADGALGSNKAFPYLYNFIDSDDDLSNGFSLLTGTASAVLGDPLRQINGAGTRFLTDLVPGDSVIVGAEHFVIQSVTNDGLAIATTIPNSNQLVQPIMRQRAMGGVGPLIPPASNTQLIIRMRDDYNFMPRWMNYTAYNFPAAVFITGTASTVLGDVLRQIVGVGTLFLTELIPGDTVVVGTEPLVIQSITNNLLAIATTIPASNQVGQPILRQRSSYEFWDTAPPVSPALFFNRLSGTGDPLTRFISIDMFYQPDDRFAMGGGQVGGIGRTFPIPTELLHDEHDSGIAGIKTPYMVPAKGNIVLTIYNNHTTKSLIVGGCVFGWKIRL